MTARPSDDLAFRLPVGGGRAAVLQLRPLSTREGGKVTLLRGGYPEAVAVVECKAARTVTPGMAALMQRLAEALRKRRPRGSRVDMFVVLESDPVRAQT